MHPNPPDEKSLDNTISFRCSTEVKEAFRANVKSRGWIERDVLGELVCAVNAVFEANPKPERPFRVLSGDQGNAADWRTTMRQEIEAAVRRALNSPTSDPVHEVLGSPPTPEHQASSSGAHTVPKKGGAAHRGVKRT